MLKLHSWMRFLVSADFATRTFFLDSQKQHSFVPSVRRTRTVSSSIFHKDTQFHTLYTFNKYLQWKVVERFTSVHVVGKRRQFHTVSCICQSLRFIQRIGKCTVYSMYSVLQLQKSMYAFNWTHQKSILYKFFPAWQKELLIREYGEYLERSAN